MKERYVRNLWQKGDIITSEKLNKIEEGIKANENALVNKSDQGHKHNYYDLSNKPVIPTRTSELTNDNNFASEYYVLNKIAEASLGGGSGEVDLSGYATKDDLLLKADKTHTHSQYLTEHQDISHLSTKAYVDNAVSEFVTTSTLDTRMNSKSIWCGTQSEYNAIATKDGNTLYFVLGE